MFCFLFPPPYFFLVGWDGTAVSCGWCTLYTLLLLLQQAIEHSVLVSGYRQYKLSLFAMIWLVKGTLQNWFASKKAAGSVSTLWNPPYINWQICWSLRSIGHLGQERIVKNNYDNFALHQCQNKNEENAHWAIKSKRKIRLFISQQIWNFRQKYFKGCFLHHH